MRRIDFANLNPGYWLSDYGRFGQMYGQAFGAGDLVVCDDDQILAAHGSVVTPLIRGVLGMGGNESAKNYWLNVT